MNFSIEDWLQENIGSGKKRHEELCYLIKANGGLNVVSWGYISNGNGGHREGLEQNEALKLIKYEGFVTALESVGLGREFDNIFGRYFDKYVERFKS